MPAAISEVKPRAADLLAQMSPAMYRRAYDRGISLSAWLESEDPSVGYNDGLDAFGRVVQAAGVRTTSIPEYGIWADTMDAFLSDDRKRMLAPEWIARQWRKGATGRSANTRALYTSADNIPGGVMNPVFQAAEPVITEISPAVPLSQVVPRMVGIRGNTYTAFYLTDVTAQERMVRVAEAAEIPRVALTGGDHVIKLKKYGRVIEMSYEVLRRQQIDLMALHIAQLAAQTEADKVTAAIDVIVSGDGNAGTAATSYNLTTLDPAATAGSLTLAGYLAWLMKWNNPYMATTILAPVDMTLQAFLLNSGSANIPLFMLAGVGGGFGGFRAINPVLRDTLAFGWTADAPANKLVGFDRRFALLQLTEIGSDIEEVERFATRQIQAVVMSEVNGFATLNSAGSKLLNVAA